jgi:hypothetical protein
VLLDPTKGAHNGALSTRQYAVFGTTAARIVMPRS